MPQLKPALLALALPLALVALTQAPDPPRREREAFLEERVRAFAAAYNARDLETVLDYTTEDVQWLSVAGDTILPEAQGQPALYESLAAYFDGCSSCRSSFEWIRVGGSRVVALERAHWTASGVEKSQVSVSVYEFEGELVRRVYYYPAEALAPAEAGEGDGGR